MIWTHPLDLVIRKCAMGFLFTKIKVFTHSVLTFNAFACSMFTCEMIVASTDTIILASHVIYTVEKLFFFGYQIIKQTSLLFHKCHEYLRETFVIKLTIYALAFSVKTISNFKATFKTVFPAIHILVTFLWFFGWKIDNRWLLFFKNDCLFFFLDKKYRKYNLISWTHHFHIDTFREDNGSGCSHEWHNNLCMR